VGQNTRESERRTREEILDRVEAGDRDALPELREMLREAPGAVEEFGNMSNATRKALLKKSSGGDLARREAQTLFLQDLVAEVDGPNPSALEKLLSEQVGLCWLHLRLMETVYAQLKDHTPSWGNYVQRCIDKAQRRYLQTIKTLAQIRKLGLPALQVNIAAEGGKQVNTLS